MSAEVWYLLFVFFMVGVGLWFTKWLVEWVLAQDEGDAMMRTVASFIREGADSFLKTQYTVVSYFALGLAVVVFFIYIFLRDSEAEDMPIGNLTMALITSISFLLGAVCSGFSGWCGMWVAVRTNVRGAAAAKIGSDEAIKVCLRGGAFSGMLIVSLSLFGVALLYATVRIIWSDVPMVHAPSLIVGYGFGASFVALFAQLGGGIYTKAADVGADIVGKIDMDIPEDDPRNPAVVADLVGDNVGDCAGRGADLFESTAAENIGAMILGASVVTHCPNINSPASFILYPLFCRSLGLIATIIGVLVVRSKPVAPKPDEKKKLLEGDALNVEEDAANDEEDEDPINSLNRGYFTALAIASVLIFFASWIALRSTDSSHCWWHYGLCGLIGILLSLVFVFITEYYTDCDHRPVQSIAAASVQGHGTNIIAGLAVGLESTGVPTLCIVTALLSSYWLGSSSGLADKAVAGIYGTACATMGMLASVGYILAMDTFGPIADNAGGIAEMSKCHESVRRRVDRLDAVGNTTKALTKGYAVGSAALASFLLFSAFLDSVAEYTGDDSIKVVDLGVPEVFVGAFVGVCLVFFFSALAIKAVGATAQLVVMEVRRQFEEMPGIMNDTQKPDYARCVEIVTRGALKEMVWPCFTVLIVPITDGLLFRVIGEYTNRPNLGAQSIAALLMCATIGGVLMGLFLNNAGGAWDNAKKLIETGAHGGKGSEAHKAAVTGDTVGDPCKDTAGPSLHVLVKLLSTITLVLYPLFVSPRTVLNPTPVVSNMAVVPPAVVDAPALPLAALNDTPIVAAAVQTVADAVAAVVPPVSA